MMDKRKDLSKLYTTQPENPNDPEGIREYFQHIIDVMPNNVYWLNRDCVTMGCNRNTLDLIGLDRLEDFVGITYEEMATIANWTEGQAQSFKKDDMDVMSSGKPKYNVEEPPLYGENNKPIYYLSSRVPLFDSSNNVIGVVGISVDITDLKQKEADLKTAKEQAEAANTAKTEFLENMRHDIRTPLSGIVGFAELLKADADNPDKVRENADNLVASSNALTDFLNDVLEIIELSDGQLTITHKKFSLKQLVSNITELAKPKALSQAIRLSLQYDEALPLYVMGDAKRVYRIVLELVTNALKFIKVGSVSVSLSLEKQTADSVVVSVAVSDTGPGISKADQDRIFTRFVRLTPSSKGLLSGSGVGLSVVKQFVSELEGEIHVKSTPDAGACFTCLMPFKIPLTDDDKHVENIQELAESIVKTQRDYEKLQHLRVTREETVGPVKVLLVEDNAIAMEAAKGILAKLGCSVSLASTGKAAIELACANTYHLIVMDIGLPDMDGIEVTRTIRRLEGNQSYPVPIVALTGHIDTEGKKNCIRQGMHAVYLKPLTKSRAEDFLSALVPHYTKQTQGKAALLVDEEKKALSGNVLDFEKTVRYTDGKPGMAKIRIDMFKKDTSNIDRQLSQAFASKNWKKFESIIHELHGACAYLGTPRLYQATLQLEDKLMLGEYTGIDKLYQQVLTEIKAVHAINLDEI